LRLVLEGVRLSGKVVFLGDSGSSLSSFVGDEQVNSWEKAREERRRGGEMGADGATWSAVVCLEIRRSGGTKQTYVWECLVDGQILSKLSQSLLTWLECTYLVLLQPSQAEEEANACSKVDIGRVEHDRSVRPHIFRDRYGKSDTLVCLKSSLD
jgi:hypothetical protein